MNANSDESIEPQTFPNFTNTGKEPYIAISDYREKNRKLENPIQYTTTKSSKFSLKGTQKNSIHLPLKETTTQNLVHL